MVPFCLGQPKNGITRQRSDFNSLTNRLTDNKISGDAQLMMSLSDASLTIT